MRVTKEVIAQTIETEYTIVDGPVIEDKNGRQFQLDRIVLTEHRHSKASATALCSGRLLEPTKDEKRCYVRFAAEHFTLSAFGPAPQEVLDIVRNN